MTATATPSTDAPRTEVRKARVAIIGAGFSGLGMAIRLKQVGIDDFVLLERAADLGGTWRDNSYPGCAVDVQSHLYSFSFAPNPEWSQVYAPQAEIWDYIRRITSEHDVGRHIRFDTRVDGGDWDEATQRWRLHTTSGEVEAQFVVSAMGPLSNPVPPDIPGLESFEGHTFHSARWDHDHDLTGQRVGVIGTGSSASQFVPEIQTDVEHLTVFQRTPHWTFLRMNRKISALERALYRRFPALQRLVRGRQYYYREVFGWAVQNPTIFEKASKLRLRLAVRDPELRAKLTPDYRMGCKRIIISDDFHPALTRDNVEVVAGGIAEVRPHGVVTEDGTEHSIDTLILATGFQIIPVADPLRGRGGETLTVRWSQEKRAAYVGTTVSGFPNYFMLVGPNTVTGHTSVLLYTEPQIEYVIKALRYTQEHDVTSIDVRRSAQDAFNDGLTAQLADSTWTTGGCASWYLDADGGSSALWPGYTGAFRRTLARFDPENYDLQTAPTPAVVQA